jgi:hypothetical protein
MKKGGLDEDSPTLPETSQIQELGLAPEELEAASKKCKLDDGSPAPLAGFLDTAMNPKLTQQANILLLW